MKRPVSTGWSCRRGDARPRRPTACVPSPASSWIRHDRRVMNILYTAEATATGGRDGHVASPDGVLDLTLAVPKELGGPGGAATNPEQLFAAGYASCFDNALILAGRRMKVSTAGARVTARVGIGVLEGGRFGLSVELLVGLPELDESDAERVVEAAHQVCPYSNATRGNIDVNVRVVPSPDVV